MNEEQKIDLDSILKSSELHALSCTIDSGVTCHLFNKQIETGYLTISASTKMVKKAIKLFEVFLKRMFKEGFSLSLDRKPHFHSPASALVVDEEVIPIRVKEKHNCSFTYDKFWGRRQKREPSGVLCIEIYAGTSRVPTKVLSETESEKWKAAFEEIIPYLRRAAARLKKARLAHEAWLNEWEEKQRVEMQQEMAIKERAEFAKSVYEDALLYEKAERIRRYCDLVERLSCSEEYKKKIEVARSVADWLDPTMDYEDAILSEKYEAEALIR